MSEVAKKVPATPVATQPTKASPPSVEPSELWRPFQQLRRQIDSLFEGRGISRRLRVQTHSAAAVCATVAQGVGIAIINPLTALTYAPLGLQIRRVSFSIPYTVSVVRPLHRPDSPLVDSFVQALQHHTRALHHQLQGLQHPRIIAAAPFVQT